MLFFWISFLLLLSATPVGATILYQNLFDNVTYGNILVKNPGGAGASDNKPPSLCCPPAFSTPIWNAGPGGLRHSSVLVTNPTRAGAGAAKFVLKGTDSGWAYTGFHTQYVRSELEKNQGQYHGLVRWYGFSVMLDQSWTDSAAVNNPNGVVVSQWHRNPPNAGCGDDGGSPDLTINYRQSDNRWRVTSSGNAISCGGLDTRTRTSYFVGAPVVKGQWYDWVVFANWRSDNQADLRVWLNGTEVVTQTNVVNTFNNAGPPTQVWKWGEYNAWWNNNAPADADIVTVFIDQIRMGDQNSSFAEVDPAQGGGTQTPAVFTAYKYTGTPSSNSWANVPKFTVTAPTYLNEGAVTSDADLSADVQVLWDTTALHFRAVVSDANLVRDSAANAFHDDSVVWWLNEGANLRLLASYDDTATVLEGACTTHNFNGTIITGGYEILGSIPKTCFGNPTLAANLDIDFLFQLNDDDNTGNRDARLVVPATPAVSAFTSPVVLRLSNTTINLGSLIDGPIISNIQVPAGNLTATTATVTWDTNEDATSNVDYDTNSGEDYTNSAPTPADTTVGASPHAVVLSGLAPNATYYVRPRSSNTAGIETLGSEVSFTTPAAGAATTTQVEVQIRSLFGSESTGITREGRTARLGGSFRTRFELLVQNANLAATGFIPYFTVNGGAATILGSSCLTSAVCAYSGAKTLDVVNDDQTTQQMSAGSYVTGQVKLLAQPISLAIAQNQSTELEWAVSLSDTLLAGNEQVCLVLRKEGGGALDSATPLCLTVVNSQAGTDGVAQ